ncbi:MAG: GNAT family N-acetyltransferase [Leptothrix ochracea]|uniref:GNAT family N-acetyltransferase n=1 Tax=Leptothrix ochracea TaxID=735331 RepID=UPI0034E1D1C5
MKLEKTTLVGTKVKLEPLAQSHLPGLAEAITDGALWEVPVTIVPHPQDLPQFLSNAETAFLAQRELAFVTIDMTSGSIVGSTRFRCIDIPHKRVEIGFTFIAKSWQRTYVNTEAKYLMLRHAFEQWDFNRVEFLTDVLNTKSRNAISRIGAREEGTLRSHMVMRDGRIRDSVMFSVIGTEWPLVKRSLEVKLDAAT